MGIELTTTIVWQLAVIKLLFYLFIAGGFLLFFTWRKPLAFVGLVSAFLAGTYLVAIQGAHVTWWGLQGDFTRRCTFGSLAG